MPPLRLALVLREPLQPIAMVREQRDCPAREGLGRERAAAGAVAPRVRLPPLLVGMMLLEASDGGGVVVQALLLRPG